MTIAFQGFSIKNNLSEAQADRAILNNLGGSPIGDDIGLLYNNNRNTSSISVASENIFGNTIVISNAQAIFANKTPLTIGSLTYYVKNSNGQDSFRLSTSPDLSNTVSNPPIGEYTRSDKITVNNIRNYSIVRRSPDVNRTESDSELGFVSTSSRAVFLGGRTVKDILESIEQNVNFYNFRKSKSINIKSDFFGTKQLEASGVNIIVDVDNINDNGLTATSPGLFIYNPATEVATRAFSGADNPWRFDPQVDPNNLVVLTSAFTVGSLKFNLSDVTLISKDISNPIVQTVPVQQVAPNFTHKLPVTINDETYFLCLKLEN